MALRRRRVTALELGLVLVSALLHAVWSVSIKSSRDPLRFNLLQVVLPSLATLPLLALIDLAEIPRAAWLLLGATSLAHALYFYWMSLAFAHGELTLVYPITRSTPALLPLFAVPLLDDAITPTGGLGIAIVVSGLWLVHASPSLRWSDLGGPAARFAYLTLASTVAYSLIDKAAMVELASARWTSPVPRAAVYYLLSTCGCGVLFLALSWQRRGSGALAGASRGEFGAACRAACVSFASYGLVLKALETAPASYVVAARQSSVLFALALGVVSLGERPGRARSLGAVITVVGVAMIGLWGTSPAD